MRLPKITEIDRIVVSVPFTEHSAPWNALLVGQWRVLEILRVATEDPDVVGWGETVLHYTSSTVPDAAVTEVRGTSPADHMWNPELGAGMQMALFDAVGKGVGLPVHKLLGAPRVREWCPIAWWNTKMPADVLAAEAQRAVSEGYRAHKFKARPWFDIREQVAAIASVTPDDYVLDIDWNRMLVDHATAVPVLTELDQCPQIGVYESPIASSALDDYRRLRDKLRHPIADHFNASSFAANVAAQAFDGYVFTANAAGGGVGGLLRQGMLAETFDKCGWVQMVGNGLTTALALHVASVLPAARWPLVTAMNTYANDLLMTPIEITGGYAHVPAGAGLGVDVNEEAVFKLKMEPPYRIDYPRTILAFTLADGRVRHYASMKQLWVDCRDYGNMPAQSRGASLKVYTDDGSNEFADLYLRASSAPVWSLL